MNDSQTERSNTPKVFGVPRSGSTVIFNIVNYLFNGSVAPQRHSYFEDNEDGTLKTVATYRDFRDSCISQWRAYYGGFDEDDKKELIPHDMLTQHVTQQLHTINELNKYKSDHERGRQVLFLKYEDFFDNEARDLKFDYLFEKLQSFFDIEISDEQKNHIRSEYCFSNQKKKAKKFKDFHEYDEETHLHGHHLYKGGFGSWRELVPPEYHKMVNETLEPYLKSWGYQV